MCEQDRHSCTIACQTMIGHSFIPVNLVRAAFVQKDFNIYIGSADSLLRVAVPTSKDISFNTPHSAEVRAKLIAVVHKYGMGNNIIEG